jgi:hypothetical protein
VKPFVWRPGAPNTPIPGRDVKRGRKPRRDKGVPLAVVRAAALAKFESLGTYTVVDAGSITFGPPDLTLDIVEESVKTINAMRGKSYVMQMWFSSPVGPTEYELEFEMLNAQIERRGPTFEVDRAGRCMVCGLFGCSWWAAFCAWRAGTGERPNWRDGSIDTTCSEVGAQALLEGGQA